MRKLIWLVIILVVLLAAGLIAAFFYIDSIAKQAVERGGTYALGVNTTLRKADVEVFSGAVTLNGLRVANPEGFAADHFLRLGEGDDASEWKLMTFGDRAKGQPNEFILDRTGMRYITIMVKDLTPFLERIKKHNVKLLGETPLPLGSDRHFVLIQDPDGTFVELIGPMK